MSQGQELHEFEIDAARGRLKVIATKDAAAYIADCVASAEDRTVKTSKGGKTWRTSEPGRDIDEEDTIDFENADEATRYLHDGLGEGN